MAVKARNRQGQVRLLWHFRRTFISDTMYILMDSYQENRGPSPSETHFLTHCPRGIRLGFLGRRRGWLCPFLDCTRCSTRTQIRGRAADSIALKRDVKKLDRARLFFLTNLLGSKRSFHARGIGGRVTVANQHGHSDGRTFDRGGGELPRFRIQMGCHSVPRRVESKEIFSSVGMPMSGDRFKPAWLDGNGPKLGVRERRPSDESEKDWRASKAVDSWNRGKLKGGARLEKELQTSPLFSVLMWGQGRSRGP